MFFFVDWRSSCIKNSAFNPLHNVHMKLTDEQPRCVYCFYVASITNKRYKRRRRRRCVLFLFLFSFYLFCGRKGKESKMKKKKRVNECMCWVTEPTQMNTTNNEHQFCRLFILWFLVCCVVHVALSLYLARLQFIHIKCMEYIDKWMRSGFLNKNTFFSLGFIIALIWIDEHVQLSILSRELILMLIWYHSDTFYTVGHPIKQRKSVFVCVILIKRSHGFFVRKIWSQIQNKL